MSVEFDLNNIRYHLPDEKQAPITSEPKIRPGFMREKAQQLGILDTRIGDYLTDKAKHSSLFLGQTYRQYFYTVDQLVEELKLNKDILDLKGPRNWKAFTKAMKPLVERLLEMGYSPSDFTS